MTTAPEVKWGWAARLVEPAFALALVSMFALAAAPLGWRASWWPLAVSFGLMALAGISGILAAVFAQIALLRAPRLPVARVFLLAATVLWGAGLFVIPFRIWLRHAPAIHDITTDTVDPPAIVTALPAREAEHASSAAYGGAAVAAAQQAAYPDIAPAMLAVPPPEAFALALATAKAMQGWSILSSDPAAGRIEASEASFWFGFVDDIVIRVAPAPGGSRVDIRSLSRQGVGDLGVNADRVRAYVRALKAAAG